MSEKKGTKDESFCYTVCDLLCNLKRNAQWIMVLLSILASSCLIFIPNLTNCQLKKIAEMLLSVFPSTLGLSIAAYAIVISFQSDTLKKLLNQDEQGVKPFHVVCASMIFNGLLQTFTIITTLVYLFFNVSFLFYISIFLACYSLIQILDILLQLLGLRTFVARYNESNAQF